MLMLKKYHISSIPNSIIILNIFQIIFQQLYFIFKLFVFLQNKSLKKY